MLTGIDPLDFAAEYRIADDLKPVDRLCDRWKEQAWDWPPGGGTPIYRAMKEAEGAGLPGGFRQMSDDVLALDGILARSPHHRAFVVIWYVQGGSIEQKGRRLRISRSQMYKEHAKVMSYLQGRLHAAGVKV